jgi:hypothetical protein
MKFHKAPPEKREREAMRMAERACRELSPLLERFPDRPLVFFTKRKGRAHIALAFLLGEGHVSESFGRDRLVGRPLIVFTACLDKDRLLVEACGSEPYATTWERASDAYACVKKRAQALEL